MTRRKAFPLSVDISRLLEVLAAQIYQSPLALIRENLQNAFDAILLRSSLDEGAFEGRIEVTIEPDLVAIRDNGIGMSMEDIQNHFWRAGSSSKNTDQARAAGVVGTFGIGAMANFGIADEIIVESQHFQSDSRIRSSARRDSLSATEDCIELEAIAAGESGTVISAAISPGAMDAEEAIEYATDCVRHVSTPVFVNGELVSQCPLSEAVEPVNPQWTVEQKVTLKGGIQAHLFLTGDGSGDIRVEARDVVFSPGDRPGALVLRSGDSAIRTFRTGFSLATTTVSSAYNFGGVADFSFLRPTAGREALAKASQQSLQDFISTLESWVSVQFSKQVQCDLSRSFMQWLRTKKRFDLCDNLTIRVEPENYSERLGKFREKSVLLYEGGDPEVIKLNASEDTKLLVLASNNPRRSCQVRFLESYSHTTRVHDAPVVLAQKKLTDYSLAESALVFRISAVLESDYFLKSTVEMAELSHGVPVLVNQEGRTPTIFINEGAQSVSSLLALHESESQVFGHMVKDFVRSTIFPKVSDMVPSATREGAEAFLKRIRSRREVFEYEETDMSTLSEIWADVLKGKISVDEGARRSQVVARRNIQEVDSASARSARDIVPDVSTADASISADAGEAMPAISRTDIETDAKMLFVPDEEEPVAGYRCFLALSDSVRDERGDFFLQPHATDIVWGGQRVLFVFVHQSGRFGLYYDVQTDDLVSEVSGGGPFPTATIFMKNRIFIPLPPEIQGAFIPEPGELKRLEVRADFLHTDG